jgi:cytochrome P450
MTMQATLPPGPRLPSLLQTIGWWNRPTVYVERLRERYGARFTMRLLGQPPSVVLSDPDDLRELFMAPPDVLHPGEGARLLEPIVGANSVILLDEAPHMEQRKLMLPAFHGERMQRLTGLMTELTDRELDSWPTDEPVTLHERLQGLTMEIILRTVFGLDEGARLESLRDRLTSILSFGDSPVSLLPAAQRALAGRGRFGRFEEDRAQVDRELFALMADRRREGGDRDDVLAMLLAAKHEDGSPMSDEEIRDELLTALVAGHETTASSLAFAFEQLARRPEVQERLAADPDDDRYLDATINEVLRLRPVLPNAEPRLVKQEVTIGGWTYPPGVVLIASAALVHHDPAIYPEPHAFRPERFLDAKPGTYTWIPFGGGRRRCIGASFALLEMRIVLRAAAERFTIATAGPPQRPRRRMITITPGDGARVRLGRRDRSVSQGPAEGQSTNAEPIAT